MTLDVSRRRAGELCCRCRSWNAPCAVLPEMAPCRNAIYVWETEVVARA